MTKQTIAIGSTANDGTGTPLRDAMDMVNDNFSELYARGGPMCGTKYPEMMNAVKYFRINKQLGGQYFFIKTIVAGSGTTPNYVYTVTVCRTGVLGSSPAGVEVMTYTATVAAYKTGWAIIELATVAEGFTGWMIIDWSALAQGSTYSCDEMSEGGLFAPVVISSSGSGTMDDDVLEVTVDETELDGTYGLYSCTPSGNIDVVSPATYADIVGDINIVNPSAHVITFTPGGTETINGLASSTISIAARGNISLRPYDGNFLIVSGNGYTINTP